MIAFGNFLNLSIDHIIQQSQNRTFLKLIPILLHKLVQVKLINQPLTQHIIKNPNIPILYSHGRKKFNKMRMFFQVHLNNRLQSWSILL